MADKGGFADQKRTVGAVRDSVRKFFQGSEDEEGEEDFIEFLGLSDDEDEGELSNVEDGVTEQGMKPEILQYLEAEAAKVQHDQKKIRDEIRDSLKKLEQTVDAEGGSDSEPRGFRRIIKHLESTMVRRSAQVKDVKSSNSKEIAFQEVKALEVLVATKFLVQAFESKSDFSGDEVSNINSAIKALENQPVNLTILKQPRLGDLAEGYFNNQIDPFFSILASYNQIRNLQAALVQGAEKDAAEHLPGNAGEMGEEDQQLAVAEAMRMSTGD
ncbi:uncharacterized protein LOC113314264 isoform X3 [Papaver somniferum]|uniref:uncharacterized protein LOC113314264 isoform X3 n=1 Tax=Papaver somniferum TaxID=3469 RepID=UPI000E6F8E98|nr:uncharacterized protein LOC113314264 isoform X3 [Papaver somniferum]